MSLPQHLRHPPLGSLASDSAAHLSYLTNIRNAVIGSRTKKAAIASNQANIDYFVALLTLPASSLDIRSQAATVLGSIAHTASLQTLHSLLRAHTPQHLIQSLSTLFETPPLLIISSASPQALKALESILRALRIIICTVSDYIAASPRWGLGSGWGVKGGLASASSVHAGGPPRGFFSNSSCASSSMDQDAEEEQRQVRVLGRQAIAYCYSRANLNLILAPLMLIPSHIAASNSASSSSASSSATADSFPSNTRVRLNNITEIVCALLASSLAIPGPGPGPDSATSPQDEMASETSVAGPSSASVSFLPPNTWISPEVELYERRIALLNFRARQALAISAMKEEQDQAHESLRPDAEDVRISHRLLPGPSTSTSALRSGMNADGMQAELLHSPSRSGSLDRERDRRAREQVAMYGTGGPQSTATTSAGPSSKRVTIAEEPIYHMASSRGSSQPQRQQSAMASSSSLRISGYRDARGSLVETVGPSLQLRAPDVGLLEVLVDAVEGNIAKTREAALWAMAELVRDCPIAAERILTCPTASGEQPTTMLLRFREDPNVDVRLAAFCCMANIVKVHNFGHKTNEYVLAALIELLDPSAPPMSIMTTATLAAATAGTRNTGLSYGPPDLPAPHHHQSSSAQRQPSHLLMRDFGPYLSGTSPSLYRVGGSSYAGSGLGVASSISPSADPGPILLGSAHDIDIQIQACLALANFLTDAVPLQVVAHYSLGIVPRVARLVEVSWAAVRKWMQLQQQEEEAKLGLNAGGEGGTAGSGLWNASAGISARSSSSSLSGSIGKTASGGAPTLIPGSGGRLVQSGNQTTVLSEGIIRLLEASLDVLATCAFHTDEIRQALVELTAPNLMTVLPGCLSCYDAIGVQVAAARLVRALSRSVSLLRTSLVDAGVGEKLLELLITIDDVDDEQAVFKKRARHQSRWRKGREQVFEVQLEVVAAICNMALQHSPMHQALLDANGIQRLVALLDYDAKQQRHQQRIKASTTSSAPLRSHSTDFSSSNSISPHGSMVINVLWALKNIAYRSTHEVKRSIGTHLGWDKLMSLCLDADALIQEQALNLLRNLASSDEEDIELVIRSVGLDRLLDMLETIIWERKSDASSARLHPGPLSSDPGQTTSSNRRRIGEDEGGNVLVLAQVAHVLLNLATGGRTIRMAMLDRPNLLDATLFFINHPKEELRNAGVWCACNLTYRFQPNMGTFDGPSLTEDDVGLEAVKRLRAFNFESRLTELLQREEALNVRDRAHVLLSAFEAVK
ncbi:hypothetical protein OC845_005675 [Tilletia horrida]|nr:hypothetical protein OC845_005675 [Tilletia horrida]